MEQAAVQQIANLAIASQGNMPLNVDDQASIANVPEGFKVVSTEKFNAQRDRFRGEYSTSSIPSFVEYVDLRQEQSAVVQTFISTERGLVAKTFFNLGDIVTPGHADDVAILTLQKIS